MPVVEAKLGFFQMQLELVLSHIMELCQSMPSIAPERLDAVDASEALDEFVIAVIDPKALLQTQINPPIIASSAVGVDAAVGGFTPDDGLQRGPGGFGDDFGMNALATFEQAKDDGFTACARLAFAAHTSEVKIGLIGFKLARERRLRSAFLSQTDTDTRVRRIDRAHGEATQLRDICGGQVHGKRAQ